MVANEQQTSLYKREKWDLNKFFNKFIVFNLVSVLGILMLILSILRQEVFNNDTQKIIANITVSGLVAFVGIVFCVLYSILLKTKGQFPHYEKLANGLVFLSWFPLIGLILAIIWKHHEKQFVCKQTGKKNKLFLPNAISIIFCALVLTVIIIWLFYLAGLLKPEIDEAKNIHQKIPGVLDIFLNPLIGFTKAAPIIIFMFIFSGTYTLVNETRAIEAGVGLLTRKLKGKEIIMIPILMLLLGICGTTFGMCEELLPLFLMVIPFFYAAGYDRMTGFLVVFMSAGIGVMASTLNPFIIHTCIDAMGEIAEEANITAGVGIVWRLIMFIVLILISISLTMVYARRVKKDPKKSCVYMSKEDFNKTYSFDQNSLPPMTRKHAWTLGIFGVTFLLMIVCFIDWEGLSGGQFTGFSWLANEFSQIFPYFSSCSPIGQWGIVEATMLFFIAALIIGAINWQSSGHWFSTFYKGCADFIGVAFVIAVARGLAITFQNSGFDQMVANGVSSMLTTIGNIPAILLIFGIISALTIFIPSTSGLSSVMMPVFSNAIFNFNPALLSGTITTFGAAMGWVNLFTPSGMVIPFLEISKMNVIDFSKAAWKQILILLVAGLGLLVIGTFLPKGIF